MIARPPFVIHVNEMSEYPDAVYIGRAVPRRKLKRSFWANEFTVAKHGRGNAVDQYRDWLLGWIDKDGGDIRRELSDLTGKPLACWCRYSKEERAEDNACHGDVLIELWKEHCDA